MYTLYTDKSENFKCNIGVEGANISQTQARLVLENKDLNLLFEGKINSDGSCVIPIKQLKNILQEGSKGKMRLEVIAEDTFFSPWEDDFNVKTNKKVTVEVESDDSKQQIKETQIRVEVIKPDNIKSNNSKTKPSHGKLISELLNRKGIRLNNINNEAKLKVATNLIEKYIRRYNVEADTKYLMTEILDNLK